MKNGSQREEGIQRKNLPCVRICSITDEVNGSTPLSLSLPFKIPYKLLVNKDEKEG